MKLALPAFSFSILILAASAFAGGAGSLEDRYKDANHEANLDDIVGKWGYQQIRKEGVDRSQLGSNVQKTFGNLFQPGTDPRTQAVTISRFSGRGEEGPSEAPMYIANDTLSQKSFVVQMVDGVISMQGLIDPNIGWVKNECKLESVQAMICKSAAGWTDHLTNAPLGRQMILLTR